MTDDIHPPPPPLHPSDLTVRFTAQVRRPADEVRLDEACTLVAAHFTTGPDPDGTDLRAVQAGLDALASDVVERTFDGVVTQLDRSGLAGDATEYAHARGSYLPDVVRRRRGLPILLAVTTVEVARRVGVRADVIGMPGHVLVASADDPSRLADPFHRRPQLSAAEAQDLFGRLHGPNATWDRSFLDPVGPHTVVTRVLSNLANRFRAESRHREEAVALGLQSLVPGTRPADRVGLASALARSGRFGDAATELETLAELGGAGSDPDDLLARATRWRARLN